jgi:hypothetical protein
MGQPIYAGDGADGSGLVGVNVRIQFGITGVRSGSVQVEVVPSERPKVHASFNLSRLQ